MASPKGKREEDGRVISFLGFSKPDIVEHLSTENLCGWVSCYTKTYNCITTHYIGGQWYHSFESMCIHMHRKLLQFFCLN